MIAENIKAIEILNHASPFSMELLTQLGLVGLSVGCSHWNLRPMCLNVDLTKIETRDGQTTEYGKMALVGERNHYLEYDVTKPLPLPDASFDWVHSEHLIEHLPQQGVIALLKEVRRVLKPGGLLRLTTPDLALYVDGYRDPERKFFKEHARILDALKRMIPDSSDDDLPQIQDRPAWMINQIFQCWGHTWIYDFDELVYVLREAGFTEEVERRSFRKGRNPAVCALDLALRRDETIYVEVVRG